MIKQIFSLSLIALFTGLTGALPVFSQDKIPVFPDESLQSRLERIVREGEISISYTAEAVQNIQVSALKPQNAQPEEWLRESLRNSGLTYSTIGDRMYAVTRQAKTITAAPRASQSKGLIAGTVLDENGEPVTGAIAVVLGLPSIGTATDADGKYVLSGVPDKTVAVQFSLMSYETLLVEDVKVVAGKTIPLNVVLKEASMQLDEVVVTTAYRQASAAGLYAVQKLNASMTDGLSADLIKRTSDNNVAQVLKRVAGVTIQDNKYVTVRGMSERYNNVQLNGSSLPSTEPNRRNFSFDIIPSSLIENVVVNKTFTPDLPGEFTGGLVQVKTLSIPDEKFLSITAGTGGNTISTGKEFQTNKRFESDYFLGETACRTWYAGHEAEQVTQSITNAGKINHYGIYKYTAAPLQNYALSFGLPLKITPKHKIGLVAAATYRHEETREDIKDIHTFGRDSLAKNLSDHFNKNYKFVTAIGAVANIGWETDNHAVIWRNLFNNRFTHTTLNRMIHESYETSVQQEIYSAPLQARLAQTQLDGEHFFFRRKLKLTWSADYNETSRISPDDRFAQANVNPAIHPKPYRDIPSPNDTYFFDWRWALGTPKPYIGSQFVMHNRLYETKNNATANVEYSFRLFDREQKLKAGYLHSFRNADYNQLYLHAYIDTEKYKQNPANAINLYHFYDPANFDSGALYYKTGGYSDRAADYYEGEQTTDALYLMGEIAPLKSLRIIGGIRIEDAETKVQTFYHWYDPVYRSSDSLFIRTGQDWLPSITAIYAITPSLNFRAAYSESLARADFRELTSVEYYNVSDRVRVKNIKPLEQSSSRNYDLRLEWYPSIGEVVSVSAFYKDFVRPVEKVMREQADGQNFDLLTVNLNNSVMRGLEFNFRKSFEFIARPLSDLWLSGNIALIKGTVEAESELYRIKKRERTLQGLSPYNINASLMYEGDRFGAVVNYTRVGRTLLYGGEYVKHDIYENPRNILDLQLYVRFFGQRMEVKLNASDVLNEDIITYRNCDYDPSNDQIVDPGAYHSRTHMGLDYNEGDYVMSRIGKGINLSATLSWKF